MNYPTLLAFKQSRWYKGLLSAAAIFLVYTLLGFFVLPLIIKWQMLKHLPETTKRQAAIQQVKVNPWTLSLTVRGLALTEPDSRPFASWDELYVNFQASSLFRLAWTFKEIRLVKPFGEVILFKDGRLNFANMLGGQTNAPPPPSQPAGIPRVNIFRVEVTNGFFAWEDRTRRSVFRTEYRPINVRLQDFNTRPNADTPYSFRAESDAGRTVTWAGDLSVQPLRSSGHLELSGIRLSRYQPYVEDFTRSVVTNGLADVQVDYRFEADTNGTQLQVTNGVVHVEQVAVVDPDTGETVAGLRGLEVQQAEFNLGQRAARVGSVRVSEASLLTRLKKGGRLNLLDLILQPEPATNGNKSQVAAQAPFVVSVDDFTIEKTAVSFEDLTRQTSFKTELKPIEVNVMHFTTRADSDANYSFQITSEAAEKFEGEGSFSINPLRSSGEAKFSSVELKKYLPYVEGFFRGKITAGKVQGRVPYRFALGTNNIMAGVTNLTLKLTDLDVLMPESAEQVTHIAEISFNDVDASLEDRRGRVGLFKGSGGSVILRRERDGALNLLGLLAVSRTNVPATSQSALAPTAAAQNGNANPTSALALGGWVLNLDELMLDNYTVKVEDLQASKPASFLLDQVALNIRGASTASNRPIAASVSLRLNETATIGARGIARISPLSAEFDVGVTNLDVRWAQPYIDPIVRLGIVSGGFSTIGKVGFQVHDPATAQLTFVGGVSLTNFSATDQVVFKEFVRWDELGVSGIDFGFKPNRLKVDEVKLVRPGGSVIIGPDRRPNLSMILGQEVTHSAHTVHTQVITNAPTKPSAAFFPMQLGTLKLDRASFGFADESIQPRAAFAIEALSGTIKGLSTEMKAVAEVDLAGKVDEQSPFAISGKLNPFATQMYVDLVLSNANTQLTPLTGYLEKYAGHPLKKGRLSSNLRYHIEGKELKAENKIQIDQLTLGPRNNSPDATTLPVKLGVALLKDNNGRIELDVPISGRLDDPQFSIGPIALKVVVNLLVKAAASPFKLLGALVGGGEELSFIEFSPGTTNVSSGELEKLDKLARALDRRPSLNLEIEGSVDSFTDRDALAKQRLREKLKARQLQELKSNSKTPQSAENFVLQPEEYDRLLRAAFAEQFGTNIAAILRTNQLSVATNQPDSTRVAKAEPGRTLFQRVFGGDQHAARVPAEKHLGKADRLALDQATPEVMETLLAQSMVVSNGDYRQLMEARARWVRDFLVQNGKVTPDRLLLVAPKTVDAAYRGETRANLSLN